MFSQSGERNAFLSGLSAAESAIFRSHLTPAQIRVGERLHSQGDRISDVVFPHSGLVAMTMPLRRDVGAGAVLSGRDGIIGGLDAAAAAPATCDADVYIGGEASRMSAIAYRDVLDQNPSVRRRAARFSSAMMAQAQQTALCHAAHAVEARICRLLLEVQDRSGNSAIPLTQGTVAQMLGIRRTTVTLVAGRLEAAGVLRCHRGYMQIITQAELERRSCECYTSVRSYLAQLFAGESADEPAKALGESSGGSGYPDRERRRAAVGSERAGDEF
jgi:CRP-like cAMP-binding protein